MDNDLIPNTLTDRGPGVDKISQGFVFPYAVDYFYLTLNLPMGPLWGVFLGTMDAVML